MRRILVTALAAASLGAMASSGAHAATTVNGQAATPIFNGTGNDCPIPRGGGFSNCYATQDGIVAGAPTDPNELGSPIIYKYGSDGNQISDNFPTIDGSEFTVSLNTTTNTLTFTYTPAADDPSIHYFSIKQGTEYTLFYDANPITSGSIALNDLGSYWKSHPGFSHIDFYDSGSAVPEPATWALMLLGFGGIGMALRRSRKQDGRLLQIA